MARQRDLPLITTVDDELYGELIKLEDEKIVLIAVWEDSLAEALDASIARAGEPDSFDIDLYLEGGAYFELYGVTCFTDLDGDPLRGHENAEKRLADWGRGQSVLEEVAVDDEDSLVLVLRRGVAVLYLVVGAWLLEQWDELPGG